MQRGTASGIVKAIERSVTTVMEITDFLSKLIAHGSDSAPVMLGHNAGVFALLKEMQLAIIVVHCCGYHLELAYKDTVKKIPSAQKVVTLLAVLYYMYQNTPLNRTNPKNPYQHHTCKHLRNKMNQTCTMST